MFSYDFFVDFCLFSLFFIIKIIFIYFFEFFFFKGIVNICLNKSLNY